MSEQRVVIVASGGGIPAVSVQGGNVSGSAVTISGNIIGFAPQAAIQFSSGYSHVYTGGSGLFSIALSGAGMGTGNSGGNVLFSCGPIINCTIRSYSGNLPMFIGGVGIGNAAASGVGIELFNQEVLTLKVTNTNQISIFNEAGGSGQGVSIITTSAYGL